MERPSGSGPHNDTYEKVAFNDPELDSEHSDDGTVTPTTLPNWPHNLHRRKPRTLLSKFWLCIRVIFITASVITWAASLWLTHLASRELGRARSLIPNPSNSSSPAYGEESSALHYQIPVTSFIPGGTLPVPGYGLAYNTSYCNGWADPEGAKARDCVLDPSQGGWVHQLCHDPALRAEWVNLPDFGWYLDSKRKQQIPQAKVWAADIPGGVLTPLYTAMDFHVQHCNFVMSIGIQSLRYRHVGKRY